MAKVRRPTLGGCGRGSGGGGGGNGITDRPFGEGPLAGIIASFHVVSFPKAPAEDAARRSCQFNFNTLPVSSFYRLFSTAALTKCTRVFDAKTGENRDEVMANTAPFPRPIPFAARTLVKLVTMEVNKSLSEVRRPDKVSAWVRGKTSDNRP